MPGLTFIGVQEFEVTSKTARLRWADKCTSAREALANGLKFRIFLL